MLTCHFRGMLIVIFRMINCNKEQQVINCCFLADLVLKFSTEIDIFIDHLKNWLLLNYSIDSSVQCCPEKANSMQNLFMVFWDFLSSAALCAPPDNLSIKTPLLLNDNRKCNCESEVNSRKLAVLKKRIFWKSNSCEKV